MGFWVIAAIVVVAVLVLALLRDKTRRSARRGSHTDRIVNEAGVQASARNGRDGASGGYGI